METALRTSGRLAASVIACVVAVAVVYGQGCVLQPRHPAVNIHADAALRHSLPPRSLTRHAWVFVQQPYAEDGTVICNALQCAGYTVALRVGPDFDRRAVLRAMLAARMYPLAIIYVAGRGGQCMDRPPVDEGDGLDEYVATGLGELLTDDDLAIHWTSANLCLIVDGHGVSGDAYVWALQMLREFLVVHQDPTLRGGHVMVVNGAAAWAERLNCFVDALSDVLRGRCRAWTALRRVQRQVVTFSAGAVRPVAGFAGPDLPIGSHATR